MSFDATWLLGALVFLAAGRGENPDGGGGILIIVISIVAVILVLGTVLTLVARKTRG